MVGELILLASQKRLSFSAYVRGVLEDHVREQVKNMGVLHPDSSPLDRAVKRFVLGYRGVRIAGLPGKERRGVLENLAWKSLEEAIAYAKSQEDPELRLLAMRLATALMRTELAILHEQDAAAVDELLEELEVRRRELATRAKERNRKTAKGGRG